MKTGKVIYWNNAKFYGFIRESNSDAEFFAHGTNFLYADPHEGDSVSFDTAQSRNRENPQEQAVKIQLL